METYVDRIVDPSASQLWEVRGREKDEAHEIYIYIYIYIYILFSCTYRCKTISEWVFGPLPFPRSEIYNRRSYDWCFTEVVPKTIDRCPRRAIPCPSNATQCKNDSDCRNEPGERCCMTKCGSRCITTKLTGCEHLTLAALKRSRALGFDGPLQFVPRCNNVTGEFEKIQCDPKKGICWCVDAIGREISGSRVPDKLPIDCNNLRECPAFGCRMFCAFGFEVLYKDHVTIPY